MKRYVYIGIRRDLSGPQQVVQAVHAAMEATYLCEWEEHPSVIVLGFKSEKALENFKDYVHNKPFHYEEFREPDRNNELTSVAVFPVGEDEKILFKRYQLLK